jgi:hypothetical protein
MGNASIFAGSDVKILKDNLNFNGKSKIISVNGNPSSGSGVAATAGTIGIDYTTGKIYRKISSLGDWAWSEIGGTNTSINYYANPDTGPIGWTSYNDGAAAPVDGSGGSSTGITFNRSTDGLLRGTSEILLDKNTLNNSLGSGRAYDFTIDKADVGKTLEISFDFSTSFGYADGNLTVWIIQDPTGTPVVIQPTTYKIPKIATDTASRFVGTFQTQGGVSAIRNYRLCLHVSTSSIALWDATIDNIRIGPQTFVYGAPITDWQAYTPTVTGITIGNGTLLGLWRRVGDSIEVKNHFTAGTTSASTGQWSFSLPSGLSFAGPIDSISDVCAGTATWLDSGVARFLGGVRPGGTNTVSIASLQGGATKYDDAGSGGPAFTNGDTLSFIYTARITGWSSSVQMSNDTDTRVVAARYAASGSRTPTSVKAVNYDTKTLDTHSAVTTVSGDVAGWRFTAPIPGIYKVAAISYQAVAAAASVVLYKNGSFYCYLQTVNNATINSASTIIELVAGDYIDVRSDGTPTLTFLNQANTISIERLSGPSVIAASETVAASYWLPANQSSGTTTPINFSSRQFDSHGAVTTGAAWKFTAPIAGTYNVSIFAYVPGNNVNYSLYKNGSIYTEVAEHVVGQTAHGSLIVQLIAGDYLDLRTGATQTVFGSTFNTYSAKFHIHRIGN